MSRNKVKRPDVLAEFTTGDYSVIWIKEGKKHSIIYGQQIEEFSASRFCVDAAESFGLCVRHSLECAGAL